MKEKFFKNENLLQVSYFKREKNHVVITNKSFFPESYPEYPILTLFFFSFWSKVINSFVLRTGAFYEPDILIISSFFAYF